MSDFLNSTQVGPARQALPADPRSALASRSSPRSPTPFSAPAAPRRAPPGPLRAAPPPASGERARRSPSARRRSIPTRRSPRRPAAHPTSTPVMRATRSRRCPPRRRPNPLRHRANPALRARRPVQVGLVLHGLRRHLHFWAPAPSRPSRSLHGRSTRWTSSSDVAPVGTPSQNIAARNPPQPDPPRSAHRGRRSAAGVRRGNRRRQERDLHARTRSHPERPRRLPPQRIAVSGDRAHARPERGARIHSAAAARRSSTRSALVSITAVKDSAAKAVRAFHTTSPAGRALLRRAGLSALPGLRYSAATGVLVLAGRRAWPLALTRRPRAGATGAEGPAASARRRWGFSK